MLLRWCLSLAFCAVLVSSTAAQTVVRFETTMGDFDIVLNPTNNSSLQGNVDNLLDYVEADRYRGVWINRADENFVLQMGGFYSNTKRPPRTSESVQSVAAFAPVVGAPGIPGLSNTAGTVSFALSGSNANSGTSSFFVNIGNNTGLDNQFTVFGAIADMTVINQIMALTNIDRTTEPVFGEDPNNLAFTDVPVMGNGQQVFITRTFVLADSMAIANAVSAVSSTMAASASAASGGGGSGGMASVAIPEPASLVSILLGLVFAGLCRRRSRS